MVARSLYDLLGLRPTASDEQVRAAYRSAARRSHPDAGGSKDEFELVNAAYRVLSDPARRRRYDLQLASSLDPVAQPTTSTSPGPTRRGGVAVPRPDVRARRAYYIAMAVCVTLFVLAGAVVRIYSVPVAFAMMMVAALIPPAAAFAVNRVPR